MTTHNDYQVLAPDSVAWLIQAALVADRTGNEAARDMALAEAQRVAQERRLTETPAAGPCYDCRTTEERLEELEQRLQEATELALNVGQVANTTLANLRMAIQRIDELEAWRHHADDFDAMLATMRGA